MTTKIYVNLPVADLAKTREFWTSVGFSFNEQFSDDSALGMVIDDEAGIYAMLLTHEFFTSHHGCRIADPAEHREAVVALGVESRERVDQLVDNAAAAGAAAEEGKDEGFMYHRAFEDIDGHRWAIHWMNLDATSA